MTVAAGIVGAGLSAGQVAERVAAGQTNAVAVHSSRSTADIVRANVLTRFNAITGVLFLIIMVVGPWQDGLFGLVVVANTAIGIVPELRAKRVLDRLSVIGAARPRVRRDGRTVEIPREAVVRDDVVVIGSAISWRSTGRCSPRTASRQGPGEDHLTIRVHTRNPKPQLYALHHPLAGPRDPYGDGA